MANPQASRARAEIEKQLVELSRLRNANTRDAEFKVWRQATLTLIQRIWEGDDSRSSRFRSVPFSPGTTRADAKLAREWFERGCAEAAQVLRALVEEINEHGIVKGRAVEVEESEPLPEDDNVPILSLDSPDTSHRSSSIADEPDDLRLSDDPPAAEEEYAPDEQDDEAGEILDIPDPPGARPPKPLSRPVAKPSPRAQTPESPKASARPIAPKGSAPMEAKPSTGETRPAANAKRPAGPQIPISETAPPGPARGVTVTNSGSKSGGKKPPGKDPLKDMLGFEPGSRFTPGAQDKSQSGASEKSRPPAAKQSAPPAPAAKPAPPMVPAPPAPVARQPAPPAQRPAPTHTPRPATPGAPAARAQTPRREAPPPPPDLERHGDHFGTIAPESVAPLGETRTSREITPSRPAAPARPAPPREPEPPHEEFDEEPSSESPTGTTPEAAPWTGEGESEPEAKRAHDEQSLQRAFEAALRSMARRRAESAAAPEPDPDEPAESNDLLDASPVFNVAPKPARNRGADMPDRYHTATAIAMAAIATEVEAMGVPGPDCPLARAALLELADHFERRDLTWGTVREAVRLLVEYPVVARRVLPLLVPHLDEAA
jgi:hypothetical protein